MSLPEVLLVKTAILSGASAGDPPRFVLKWPGMKPEPNAIAAALARAWRAIVKAFTAAPDARASQQYGTDTTLFGGSTEQPRDRAARDGANNEFWVPSENTDFADMDAERDAGRRR
jgi:hypothetical protein